MVNFVGHLFDIGISVSTVRVYLAAIRDAHIQRHFPDPTHHSDVLRALSGFQRLRSLPPDRRLPITIEILSVMNSTLFHSSYSKFDRAMLWSAFTLAFFGFLRSDEFLLQKPSTIQSDSLLDTDVSCSKTTIILRIRRSKTDGSGRTHVLEIQATNHSVCPVRALRRFLSARLRVISRSSGSQLFIHADLTGLTRAQFTRALRTCLSSLPNSELYSPHSFRIGAASAAALQGHSDHEIQSAGRWTSAAFNSYIRRPQYHHCPQILP